MAGWSIGIDTGGTFTDLAAVNHSSGETFIAKVPSTPEMPANAILNALQKFADDKQVDLHDLEMLSHGTTVGTNAVLEGKGARAGLLITKGFRGVYPGQARTRPRGPDLIDPDYQKAELLIPLGRTVEIEGRLNARGEELRPLDLDQVRAAGARLRELGCTSIAICFLFAYHSDLHERQAAELLRREFPDLRVSVSSEVLPVIREYPRLSTVALDAYVGPIVSSYLGELARRVEAAGVSARKVFIMQSNGGLMRLNVATEYPNETLLSGPAGGIAFSTTLARQGGDANIITFDMGGTSTEACLVREGAATTINGGKIAGQVIGTSMIEIRTIGAGGGAIAHKGPDGLLKVGPQSAGARPGPACYGLGGELPTVTDANVVLGYLDAARFLGGALQGERRLAEEAIARLAGELGLDMMQTAVGVRRVVNARMAGALRLTLSEQGCDPRDFALLAFGGCGPLHAVDLALDLGLREVIVPTHPGVSCAMGLLLSDVKHIYLRSAPQDLGAAKAEELNALYAGLEAKARDDVAKEGFDPGQLDLKRQLDVRYARQGYQLTIETPSPVTEADMPGLRTQFDARHEATFGICAPEEHAEIVTPRLVATVPLARMPLIPAAPPNLAASPIETRSAYFHSAGAYLDTPVYLRNQLSAGVVLQGPLIVEQLDSTTVVGPGQTLRVDDVGNLRITFARDGGPA